LQLYLKKNTKQHSISFGFGLVVDVARWGLEKREKKEKEKV